MQGGHLSLALMLMGLSINGLSLMNKVSESECSLHSCNMQHNCSVAYFTICTKSSSNEHVADVITWESVSINRPSANSAEPVAMICN